MSYYFPYPRHERDYKLFNTKCSMHEQVLLSIFKISSCIHTKTKNAKIFRKRYISELASDSNSKVKMHIKTLPKTFNFWPETCVSTSNFCNAETSIKVKSMSSIYAISENVRPDVLTPQFILQ